MRYVIKNIKSFIINEKLIFIVTILCVLLSAFVINFSYGLYYNYNPKIVDAEFEGKELNPEISDGETLSKKELQTYVEALDNKTLNSMIVIYASSYIDGFSAEEGYGPMAMRFVIHDGKYNVCEVTRKNYEENGLMTSGRYITNEEEATGSFVAVMYGQDAEHWEDAGENIRNDDGTVSLFGNKYKVVGTYHAGFGTPIVPFLTVPGELKLDQVGFSFEKNITKTEYENMVDTAENIIPGKLKFPELDFPDNDTIAVYNNMIYIALILSIISVVNFSEIFYYILQKRQRKLAIMRITGCTKHYAVIMYLCECMILVLPCYLAGAFVNYILCQNIFNKAFEYFDKAYSPRIYLMLFMIYIISFAVVISAMIIITVQKTIADSLREAVK